MPPPPRSCKILPKGLINRYERLSVLPSLSQTFSWILSWIQDGFVIKKEFTFEFCPCFFLIYWKIWSFNFSHINLYWKFILVAISLHRSHIWYYLVHEIKAKIRLQDCQINHVSRIKQWDRQIFCMVIQIHESWKLIKKSLGRHSQKTVWSGWSQDSKISCISRTNRWNSTNFLHADTDSGKLKVILTIFDWMWLKMGVTF